LIYFSLFLIMSYIFSYLAQKSESTSIIISLYFTSIVVLILSLLSGFRTEYNDTKRYIYNFIHYVPEHIIDFFNNYSMALGDYPGFFFFQSLLKDFVSDNPYVFIFTSSVFINILIISFYKKYSTAFSLSVFLYITSGLFMLGMGAMKQMLAVSIGIWSIHFFIKNNQKIFLFLLFLASTFHPFILLYLAVYFFNTQVWTKKILSMILATLLVGLFFTQFVETILGAAGAIGVNYDPSFILNKAGVNPLRIAIFSVAPILSYIYREEINNSEDKMIIIAVNFSIISFLFMLVASYGGANMFGRLASYFEPFTYLVIPWILYKFIPKNYNWIFIGSFIFAYSFFFYYQFVIVKNFHYKHILTNII